MVRDCAGCVSLAREVSVSWNHWLWDAIGQVHNLLNASFRERRGVVTLHTVPPPVGFALLRHFARPSPGVSREACYTPAHPSWKQGTSKSNSYHFLKYAYDNMEHVKWAFPLHDKPKECSGPVRLVSKKRYSEVRVFGTPVQFKYKWPPQRELNGTAHGVGIFTITANIGHIGLAEGDPRWNIEYLRWTAEQQLDQVRAVKAEILAFPRQPLRPTHVLFNKVHPLAEWAGLPTALPPVPAANQV